MLKLKKLLFVDTNIWLDFYRPRASDVALRLLKHLEGISERIVVTHQVEMEYKKNRHLAILEGMKALTPPNAFAPHGIFADAKPSKVIEKSYKAIHIRLATLKKRMRKVLLDPVHHDPVYQTCQRIFGRDSPLVLAVGDKRRIPVRRRALTRFLLGCPPRKSSDVSMGDAYNWEWMIECAEQHAAQLVILSRDSDYGYDFDGQSHINHHLKQEFSERVSKKAKIHLFRSMSKTLEHFGVSLSQAEKEADAKDVVIKPSSGVLQISPGILGPLSGGSPLRSIANVSSAYMGTSPLPALPVSCSGGHLFFDFEAKLNAQGQRSCPICGLAT